jgi:hypothetical protein
MSTELIRNALDLPPGRWPPDHYTLLGLPAGPVDAADVESRVLDRMERLRRYQLAHPDDVTDAMNRLAQALVCLSDPAAKEEYDATLTGRWPAAAKMPKPPPAAAVPVAIIEETPPRPYPLAPPEPVALAPIVRRPPARRRPAAGRRLLYQRLAAARHLLAAWRGVGGYLTDLGRRIRQPAEAVEFVGALLELRDRLADDEYGPTVVPGQPGALVASLARQPLPLSTYRQFLPEQRTALAADWRAGEAYLATAYRDAGRAVRRERRSAPRRALRAFGRTLVTDRLDLTLFVLGLLAIGIALFRVL